MHGNGIGLTDSANVTITNSTTRNNAWGGLALYQTNHYYDQQVSHISVDATNNFNEADPVYFEDQSSGSSDPQSVVGGSGLDYDFSTINIAGYGYAAHNTDPLDAYTWLQPTEQKAIDFLDANSLITTGYVSDWSSIGATGQFYVGTSTGGHAMSIATAVGISGAGDTINVGAGTYTDALNINHSVDIEGAGVGQTIIQPTSLLSTGVTHKYTSNVKATVFVHDTTGVTINNLTIDGNNLGNDAIVFWNNASGTISNALIENAMAYSGAQTGQGIAVDATTGNNVNLSVSGTTITNFNKNAIDALNGDGSVGSGGGNITLNVSDSTFIGQGSGGAGHQAQNGIVLWERGGGTVSATIDGSHFRDLQNEFASTPGDWAVGVLQYGSSNGTVSVSNSDFTNTQSYISTAGGVAHELDATVGNTFDGVAADTATLDQLFAIQNKIIDGLTASGNGLVRLLPNQVYVTATNGSIKSGIDAAASGDTVHVQDGTYVIPSGGGNYLNVNKSLSLIGQSEAGVIIDARNASTYGLRVSGPNSNVTLEDFTLYGSTGAGNSYGLKAEDVTNLTLANITSRGATKSEFDLNGIVNGTLTNLTADGAPVSDVTNLTATGGNGISFTNSQNITLTNSTTMNNAWGGLALYQGTTYGNLQLTGITVDGTNTFNEANGIYAEDQSSVTDIGAINLSGQGINYIAQNLAGPNDFYTFFQRTQQGAIDAAVGAGPTTAYVQGYSGTGVNGNNIFTVGYNTGATQGLSIQAAVTAAAANGTINVLSGATTAASGRRSAGLLA